MSYFRVCPRCGSHIDANELCDCLDVEAKLLEAHVGKEEVPVSATNTDEDGVEQIDKAVSTSIVHKNGGNVK